MNMAFRKRLNRYIVAYANAIVILVLTIFVLIQFFAYRGIIYSDLIKDVNLRAAFIAQKIQGIEGADETGLIWENTFNSKLVAELNSLNGDQNSIVKLRILNLARDTKEWKEIFSSAGSFHKTLSTGEKQVASLGAWLFPVQKEIWFNGEGYVAECVADIRTKNNSYLRVVADIEANSFIQQQIRVGILLILLFAGITIILILQYRLLFLKLYKPLDELTGGMKLISQGNLDYRIPVEHRDELGSFIEYFNAMVGELKKSQDALEKELLVTKTQREKIFKTYRDIIFAVTHGKFLLVKESKLPFYVEEGRKIKEITISQSEDVGMARRVSKEVISELNPSHQKIQQVLLCISEAATNIIKHAQKGIFSINKLDNSSIRFIFRDQGPGMDFNHLPSMLFFKGFSTQISLGCGFKLIYTIVDKMILSTSKHGTTVVFDIVFSSETDNQQECCMFPSA